MSPSAPSYPTGYREVCLDVLDRASPEDALTAHYLLDHPARLSHRYVWSGTPAAHRGGVPPGTGGREPPRGVLAACRTPGVGEAPLVVLRAVPAERAAELLERARQAGILEPGRRHYFITSPAYRPILDAWLAEVTDRMETVVHTPDVALLDRRGAEAARALERQAATLEPFTRNGRPACRVRKGESIVASAETLWQSEGFAEIGVATVATYRRHGYGRAAAAALASLHLGRGRTPLYIADKGNLPSLALASSLGFVPSGHEEYACSGVIRSERALQGKASRGHIAPVAQSTDSREACCGGPRPPAPRAGGAGSELAGRCRPRGDSR